MKTARALLTLSFGLSLTSAAWTQERATTEELPAALLALDADHDLILSTDAARQIRGEGGSFCPSARKRHGRIGVPSNVVNVVGEKNKIDLRGVVFVGVPVINIYGEKNKVSLKGAVYAGVPILNVVGVKNKVKIK